MRHFKLEVQAKELEPKEMLLTEVFASLDDDNGPVFEIVRVVGGCNLVFKHVASNTRFMVNLQAKIPEFADKIRELVE